MKFAPASRPSKSSACFLCRSAILPSSFFIFIGASVSPAWAAWLQAAAIPSFSSFSWLKSSSLSLSSCSRLVGVQYLGSAAATNRSKSWELTCSGNGTWTKSGSDSNSLKLPLNGKFMIPMLRSIAYCIWLIAYRLLPIAYNLWLIPCCPVCTM